MIGIGTSSPIEDIQYSMYEGLLEQQFYFLPIFIIETVPFPHNFCGNVGYEVSFEGELV